jgi:excisionase family DNA binding protein
MAKSSKETNTLTPAEIARRLRISADKVLGWIHSGELTAINVAQNPSGRPRFRVDVADYVEFQNRRQVRPQGPVSKRPRKQRADVHEFF